MGPYQLINLSSRLDYIPKLHQLVAMALYLIHEYPINYISKHIHHFLATHSLDEDNNINLDIHLNLAISDLRSPNIIIPDLHLDLGMPDMILVPFWVIECSFSSLPMALESKLQLAAKMVPEIDFAFTFCICETEFCSPPKSHDLHSHLPLARSAFIHPLALLYSLPSLSKA